jgi:hypothetical protein
VSGTVALQVAAQAVLLTSIRFIGRRMRGAPELRWIFWISLGAVAPPLFGHLAQVGLGGVAAGVAAGAVVGAAAASTPYAAKSPPRHRRP